MELNATKESCLGPEPVKIIVKELHDQTVNVSKLLGFHVQNDLKWNAYADEVLKQDLKTDVSRKANLPKENGLSSMLPRFDPFLKV